MELFNKTKEQLLDIAKDLNMQIPPKIGLDKLRRKIDREILKRRIQDEAAAHAEATAEAKVALGIDDSKPMKPSLEYVGIYGGINPLTGEKVEPSERRYYVFTNQASPDADEQMIPGGVFFHLFPNRLHVLPVYIVRGWQQTCRKPRYEDVEDPTAGPRGMGGKVSKIVGYTQMYSFEDRGHAPDDAEFGVVLDEAILSKYMESALI